MLLCGLGKRNECSKSMINRVRVEYLEPAQVYGRTTSSIVTSGFDDIRSIVYKAGKSIWVKINFYFNLMSLAIRAKFLLITRRF